MYNTCIIVIIDNLINNLIIVRKEIRNRIIMLGNKC